MKGIVALHGYKSKADWSKRVQKKKRKSVKRLCYLCQKDISLLNGNAIYCGNARKKTGCAYRAWVLRNKAWKKKVKYHLRPSRKVKMIRYQRKYDKHKRKR